MIEGKTKTGFEYKMDENVLDDAELLERFAAIQKGDGLDFFDVLEDIIGPKQKKALYEHCRDKKTKKVSLKALEVEFEDMLSHAADESPAVKNL